MNLKQDERKKNWGGTFMKQIGITSTCVNMQIKKKNRSN